MTNETIAARDLFEYLSDQFKNHDISLTCEGEETYWRVEAKLGERSCRIRCLNFGSQRGDIHLSKLPQLEKMTDTQSMEYYIKFRTDGKDQASGRTQQITDLEKAVQDWLSSKLDVSQMYDQYAFTDPRLRTGEGIASRINLELNRQNSRLNCIPEYTSIEKESREVWLYSNERSCSLTSTETDAIDCELFEHRILLATGLRLSVNEATRAVMLWMEESSSTMQIRQEIRQFMPVEFAKIFEQGDYAGWCWKNFLKRATEDNFVSTEGLYGFDFYMPILKKVPNSHYIKRFFVHKSVHRIRFTRCSTSPFDTILAVILPSQDASLERPFLVVLPSDNYDYIDMKNNSEWFLNANDAFDRLENYFATQTELSYLGNIDIKLPARFNQELEVLGSLLKAKIEQRRNSSRIIVEGKNGQKIWISSAINMQISIKRSIKDKIQIMSIRDAALTVISELE
jgi:hypothetical protein